MELNIWVLFAEKNPSTWELIMIENLTGFLPLFLNVFIAYFYLNKILEVYKKWYSVEK